MRIVSFGTVIFIPLLLAGPIALGAPAATDPGFGVNNGPPHSSSMIGSVPATSGSLPAGVPGPLASTHGPFEITAADLARLSPKPKVVPAPLSQASRKTGVKPLAGVTSAATSSWEAYGTNAFTGAPYGGLSMGGQASDSQLSVSTTHVIVTARDALAFYTKSGLKVWGVTEGKAFFTANGIPDNGSSWGIFDMRTVYDAYRQRFFITGLYESPTGSQLVVAISKTTDPTQGFWTFAFDDPYHGAPNWVSGDSGDYDVIGVGPTVYLAAANWGGSSGFKGVVLYMFDAAAMASGNSPSWWVFYNWTNPDGSLPYIIQPAVHHGSTGASNTVWFAQKWGNNAVVEHVDNPLQFNQGGFWNSVPLTGTSPAALVDGPQKGVTNPTPPPLGMGKQIGDAFLKAAWRSSKLYLSGSNTMLSGSTTLSAGRVMRINLSNFTTEIDRTFGIASQGDPVGSKFYYGWAGIEVNKNQDFVISTSRTNSTIFPELRISQWLHTDSDIESSTLLKSGEAPYHEGSVCLPNSPGWTWECWGELTGESVDPSDDTGIWVTQEYPVVVPRGFDSNYANYSMWVGEVFGNGCGHGVCTQGTSIASSCDSICVAPLCTHDPYCCNTAWDSICVSEVPTYCGGNTCNGLSP